MKKQTVESCAHCAMTEKLYLDARANHDAQVRAIRDWQAKSAACEKHNGALEVELAAAEARLALVVGALDEMLNHHDAGCLGYGMCLSIKSRAREALSAAKGER